jgi:hypothetical protein
LFASIRIRTRLYARYHCVIIMRRRLLNRQHPLSAHDRRSITADRRSTSQSINQSINKFSNAIQSEFSRNNLSYVIPIVGHAIRRCTQPCSAVPGHIATCRGIFSHTITVYTALPLSRRGWPAARGCDVGKSSSSSRMMRRSRSHHGVLCRRGAQQLEPLHLCCCCCCTASAASERSSVADFRRDSSMDVLGCPNVAVRRPTSVARPGETDGRTDGRTVKMYTQNVSC